MSEPIRQALGRLQEYAAAHPEHDTAELVADPPAPAPATDGEREELAALINKIARAWEPDVCLLGNMTARQLARAAALLRQPAPAPDSCEALAARPLLEAVARLGDRIGQHTVAEITTISDRAAAWLRENPLGQPVAIEPRGCPTPGACSCVEPPAPAPATDGEREELAADLDECADSCVLAEKHNWAQHMRRAAALLRQLPPEGLTAEEYFHADSGARIVREPCDGEPGWCWTVSNSRHVNPWTEFPTLAAAWAALQQAGRQEVGDA